jgi:RNA polymerase-binding protein DksA
VEPEDKKAFMARAGAGKSLDKPAPKARGASEAVKRAPVKAAATTVRKKAEPTVVAPKPPGKAAKTATPAAKPPSTSKNSEVAVAEAPKAKRAGTATKAPAKAAPAAAPNKASPEAASFPAKTLDKLRRLLEEERETYVRQAHDLAAEAEALAAEREPGDTQFDEESGEGDTLNVERERDLALSASATQAVEDIDAAIHRMDTGGYGVCERCGKKIAVARLEALPFAALCIECKSREERRR